MAARSIAVFTSNDLMPRTGDQFYKFRQSNDFFYLTGIDEPKSFLILCPDHPDPKYHEVLFISQASEYDKQWTGDKLFIEKAKELSGIDTVLWNAEFETTLNKLLNYAGIVYFSIRSSNNKEISNINLLPYSLYENVKKHFPLHKFENATSILNKLRTVKEKEEIEFIKKACSITKEMFLRFLAVIRSGMYEYEIEAEILFYTIKSGLSHVAFSPIIASDENACILHYTDNKNVLKDGSLVLIDFGVEYNNYCSDVTRTIPVSGKYNKRQLEIYEMVLKLYSQAEELIKPNKSLNDINNEFMQYCEKALIDLRLISKNDLINSNKEEVYRRFFKHGVSHFLGMDVHDVGNKYDKLRTGMVVTCEPGIYIRDEGIGIRLENDLLIGDNGNINLTKSIPILPEEIERIMKK